MRYPVAAPDLSGNESVYVNECLSSTWISSNGCFITEFEKHVANYSNARHAIATCNGTVALHLILAALGIGPGDEVIVPSLTFVATANAVTYCGASPVFADCEPDTWRLAPASVERLLTRRTKAIVPVHLYGHPCDMDALSQIARDRKLSLVEDAAEALGAKYKGQPVGSFGRAGMFSFFGNKIATTGEGGAVVTNDDELADRCRLLRGQGMDPNRRYVHTVVGFNYRMTNIAAAIGVAQMERIDSLVGNRQRLAGWYHNRLRRTGQLTLPIETPDVEHAFWMYSLLVDRSECRDALMADMARYGVETRPFFYPIHKMPMYTEARNDKGCPVTCDVSARGLSIPSSSYLEESDADTIAAQLQESLAAVTKQRPLAAA